MWPNFLLMQVAPPADQISNLFKWYQLVANFFLMQVAPFGGCLSDKCMWHHLLTKFVSHKVPPVMDMGPYSVVPLAMFLCITRLPPGQLCTFESDQEKCISWTRTYLVVGARNCKCHLWMSPLFVWRPLHYATGCPRAASEKTRRSHEAVIEESTL